MDTDKRFVVRKRRFSQVYDIYYIHPLGAKWSWVASFRYQIAANHWVNQWQLET
jgi:hypothetical protein